MPHIDKTHSIGLLTPSSNTVQAPEFVEVLPPNIALHSARMSLTTIDPDSTVRIVQELEQESRKLGDAGAGVIVLAATAPSSRKGKGYDRELIKRIEGASGTRATTAATALLEALTVLGIRRIALGSPWTDAINKITASFIEAHGFEVRHQEALGLINNNDVGRLDPEAAYEMARRVDRPDADAVMLGCGNWWTMCVIERLERELGKPVLSTNGVSIWAALRIIQSHDSVAGYGGLLRDYLGRGTVSAKLASAA